MSKLKVTNHEEPKPLFVQLTKRDVHACGVLGVDTVTLCKMQNLNPRLENRNQSREDANIDGVKAEFAVARLFNLDLPTLNVASDHGADLWLTDNVCIDVKCSTTGDLIFDTMEKFGADIAVLCQITDDPTVVEVQGWISRIEFNFKHGIKNYGYGDRLVMSHKDLHSIEKLWLQLVTKKFSPVHRKS